MRELAYVPSSVCPSVLEFQYSATTKYRIFTASSWEKDDYNNWRGPLECLTSAPPHSEMFIRPKCDFRSYQRQGQNLWTLSFRFCTFLDTYGILVWRHFSDGESSWRKSNPNYWRFSFTRCGAWPSRHLDRKIFISFSSPNGDQLFEFDIWLTLWCPMLPYGYSYPVPDQVKQSFVIFWHPGTLFPRYLASKLPTHIRIYR